MESLFAAKNNETIAIIIKDSLSCAMKCAKREKKSTAREWMAGVKAIATYAYMKKEITKEQSKRLENLTKLIMKKYELY